MNNTLRATTNRPCVDVSGETYLVRRRMRRRLSTDDPPGSAPDSRRTLNRTSDGQAPTGDEAGDLGAVLAFDGIDSEVERDDGPRDIAFTRANRTARSAAFVLPPIDGCSLDSRFPPGSGTMHSPVPSVAGPTS